MDLTPHQRQTLVVMPDLAFGEDRGDYVRRCIQWGIDEGYNIQEMSMLAKAKWHSWEIERLIMEIEEGSVQALQRAVVMILRDRYIV